MCTNVAIKRGDSFLDKQAPAALNRRVIQSTSPHLLVRKVEYS